MTTREQRAELEDHESRLRMMEACILVAELGALFQMEPDEICPKSVKREVLRRLEDYDSLRILIHTPLGSQAMACGNRCVTDNPTVVRIAP